MKKILVLSIVVVLCFSVSGQTEKGKLFLSGGAGLQFSTGTMKNVYDGETFYEANQSTFTLLPSFGYFIMDDLAIGLAGNITSNVTKDEDDDKYSTTSTLLMPTAIYFFPMEGNIRPLVQAGVGYSLMTEKETWDGEDDKESCSGIAFNLGGGIAYFISQNISMNFGLSFTKSDVKDEDDTKDRIKSGMFAGNIGFSIFF